MRALVGIALLLLAFYGGEWIYRSVLRPIDQPTVTLQALATRFNMSGIAGTFYPARHGFRHSSVIAVMAYKIDGLPIPFTVTECPSDAAAESQQQASPPEWQPKRNGSLVIQFPMWDEESWNSVDQVSSVFAGFRQN
ncbi:hypothetical protein SSBR45G_72840 [Bradyrhizobium sp. SSBR45G]|uniref:hypothetical protein n=1 Tax=unclassified Bradyrhizobium TaxID=2631580 RepID=UPI0023429252|nr:MULTISPECIES: hypothetical protein [unclassified Bradyrhizobium]GLH82375.1 hypothetical protein SSBR45G_72840 [Bradyrhizobium sp. SSBR45G]GLH89808.1 hypothetical protein SSBR45R_72690 [Bradyrhizobium sp. SSBR45R]